MTYSKITTYIALPVLAVTAFTLSLTAITPQANAAPSGGVSPSEADTRTPAQKKAAAERAKVVAENAKAEAKAAKDKKIADTKAKAEVRKKQIRTSYTECINGLSDIKNTATLQKLNDKILAERTSRIEKLNGKVAKMNDGERKNKLQAFLTSDQSALEAIHASSKGSTDPAVLTKSYCEAIWKLQINQFRKNQIDYVRFAQRQFTAQEKLLTGVNTAITTTTAGTSPAKAQALEQLASAKTTLTTGISADRAAAAQAMKANVSMVGGEYVNNLEKPADYAVNRMTAYQSALLDYTESVVTRKAGNQYDSNLVSKLELKSITLKDANGNKVNVQRTVKDNPKTAKDESGKTINYRAASARTAVVQVSADSQKGTVTLVRDGPKAVWKVQKNQD